MKKLTQMREAKVQLISVDNLEVYKWLRQKMKMEIPLARNLSRNGQIIDFYGDIVIAQELYDHISSWIPSPSSARLMINVDETIDTTGTMGSYGVSEEWLKEDETYRKERDG